MPDTDLTYTSYTDRSSPERYINVTCHNTNMERETLLHLLLHSIRLNKKKLSLALLIHWSYLFTNRLIFICMDALCICLICSFVLIISLIIVTNQLYDNVLCSVPIANKQQISVSLISRKNSIKITFLFLSGSFLNAALMH